MRIPSGRPWVAVGAFLVILAGLFAPTAFGATTSWEFETETFDFGPRLAGGGPTEHAFVLTNTGETRINTVLWGISWSGLEPELFRMTSSPVCRSIEPGRSCSMSVAFNPLTLGSKYGQLEARVSGGEPPGVTVDLQGEGGSPYVAIEPEELNLGPVVIGKSSSLWAITVQNQGNVDLTVKAIFIADLLGAPLPSSPFRTVGGTCQGGQTVAPGASCTILVALAPSEAGAVKSKLEMTDNAPGSSQTIELQGIGTAPPQPIPPANSVSVPTPKATKRVCPVGERSVVRKGEKRCVRKGRHRRHQRH